MRNILFALAIVATSFNVKAQLYLGSNGLNVSGSGTSAEVKLGGTLTQHTDIDLNGIYNLSFKNASSSYLSILSSGNIGIGTNAPAAKLHIQSAGGLGSGLLIESTSASAYATTDFKNSAGELSQVAILGPSYPSYGMFNSSSAIWDAYTSGGMSIISYHPSGIIKFGTGGAEVSNERMRITADGNVGIGTATPAAKLHLQSPGGLYTGLLVESTSPTAFATADFKNTAGELTQLAMIGPSYTYGIFNPSSAALNTNGPGGINIVAYNTTGVIRLATGGTDVSNERMRITAEGNVGIGISNPAAQLHTSGAVRFAGLSNDNTQTRIVVSDANGNLSYRDMSTVSGTSGWAFNGSTVGVLKSIGTTDNFDLPLITNNNEQMRITVAGDVGIGTSTPQGQLAVNGTVFAKKIKVTQLGWSDYVFDKNYPLPSLAAVEQFIQQNKHLPDVPSAAVVEKEGIDLGDNQAILLKKIEELTLYIIEQNKRIEKLEKKLSDEKNNNENK